MGQLKFAFTAVLLLSTLWCGPVRAGNPPSSEDLKQLLEKAKGLLTSGDRSQGLRLAEQFMREVTDAGIAPDIQVPPVRIEGRFEKGEAGNPNLDSMKQNVNRFKNNDNPDGFDLFSLLWVTPFALVDDGLGLLVRAGSVDVPDGTLNLTNEQKAALKANYAPGINRFMSKPEQLAFFCLVANAYYTEGHRGKALGYYMKSAIILENFRNTISQEKHLIGFFTRPRRIYDRIAELQVEAGETCRALETVEMAKARVFLDMVSAGDVKLKKEKRQAQKQARFKLAEKEVIFRGDFVSWSQMEKAKRGIRILKTVREESPQVFSTVCASTLACEALLKTIPPNAVFLNYLLTESMLITVVADSGGVIAACQTSRTGLDELSSRFQAIVAQAESGRLSFTQADSQMKPVLRGLYAAFIAPWGNFIRGRSLIISPSGELFHLPFAALLEGDTFLAERHTLCFVPSMNLLPWCMRSQPRRGKDVLLMGAPYTQGKFEDLPGARKELNSIQRTFDGGTRVLFGRNATEQNLRKKVALCRILHLATHAVFVSEAPMKSFVLLSPSHGDDGFLTGEEVFSLDLDASELVTLSACETGRSRVLKGDEMMGFIRAFMFAGARSILASLWSVGDDATCLLMERFYTHYQAGKGKAKSLQLAQMETRQEFPEVLSWAPFQLYGDMR